MKKILQTFFLFFLFQASGIIFANEIKTLQKGELDLRNWDFAGDGIIKLKGESEFYWKKYYTPFDFKEKEIEKKYGKIPKNWMSYPIEDKGFKGYGYGTYRMRMQVSPSKETMGIFIDRSGGPYKIWINGKDMRGVGVPGKSYKSEIPYYRHYFKTFDLEDNKLELILNISNYNYNKGGMWGKIYIGTEQQVRNKISIKLIIETFILGSLFIIGIHYLILFLLNREKKAFLYFGLHCINVAIRYMAVGYTLVTIFGETIPFELRQKVEYISFYVGVVLLVWFMKSLFYEEYNNKFIKSVKYVSGAHILMALIFPFRVYEFIIYFFQIYTIFLGIALLIGIQKAAKKNKPGARILIVGFFIMMFMLFSDIINSLGIIRLPEIGAYGFYIFIYFQTFVLSANYSKAYKTVNKLSKRLINLDKLKDEFLANTSHELKTPLNGIIGITESILQGVTGEISKNTKQNLVMIHTSAKRLSNLVNDILDFSKLRNKTINLNKKNIDIKKLTDIVIYLSMPLVKGKKIEIINNMNKECFIHGDEDRIKQVLHNLLGNAIKFTNEGRITINAEDKNDEILISVEDTGIGIPNSKLENIFESFEQIESSEIRTVGGTGLGLSISKKLVELHNGKIWVTSEEQKGSCFCFTIPKASTLAENKKIAVDQNIISADKFHMENINEEIIIPKELKAKNGKKILVVDDEVINLQVIINFLIVEGYEVVAETNPEKVLEIIDDTFDVVLLDIMMPKISGYEICKQIREKYRLVELPVIMLTAKTQTKDIKAGFQAGANDYVSKPVNKVEILARIKTLTKLRETVVDLINSKVEITKEHEKRRLAEKMKEYTQNLNASFNYGEIVELIMDSIAQIISYEKLIVLAKENEKYNFTSIRLNDWNTKGALLKDSDVAIEFSLPEKSEENIHKCFAAGLPVVVGTTGWDAQRDEIILLCRKNEHSLFYAPNFSYGMNMVFRLNQLLAQMTQNTDYTADLQETHWNT